MLEPDGVDFDEREYQVLIIVPAIGPDKGKFAFPGGLVSPDEEHDPRISVLRILES
jgi:ADP-ribose pyrophosphatase YjhB (NUDIX family)